LPQRYFPRCDGVRVESPLADGVGHISQCPAKQPRRLTNVTKDPASGTFATVAALPLALASMKYFAIEEMNKDGSAPVMVGIDGSTARDPWSLRL
jgi:hypothetical protein